MGRKVLAALLAALMLSGTAWAAEMEETLGTEEIRASENGEEEILEVQLEADLFQEGSLTGPQTMPDGAELFAVLDEVGVKEALYQGMREGNAEINVERFKIPAEEAGTDENGKVVYTSKKARELFSKVVNDHPELFYVRTGFSSLLYLDSTGIYVQTIKPVYYDGTEGNQNLKTAEAKTAFENAAHAALAQADGVTSDLEKALILHDYLVVNCHYNWFVGLGSKEDSTTVFSAYGALVNQDAVCQGYAMAYKYLLDRAGIEAVVITSDQINHAWNAVKIDGQWYYVDVTWDDPTPDFAGRCGHDNFLWSESSQADIKHRTKNGAVLSRDWVPGNLECTSTEYESGYAFNGVGHPMEYQGDGVYRYIKGTVDTYTVYSGTLTDKRPVSHGTIHVFINMIDGSYYLHNFGILWLNDCLYYTDSSKQLQCLSMLGRGTKALGAIAFTAAGSAEGKYNVKQDGIGLRYNGGKIQAVSTTRPNTVLASFDPYEFPNYPAEWDEAGAGTGILGLSDATNSKVGIKWGGNLTATLYAAVNTNGKLTGLQVIGTGLEDGVNLVELKTPLPVGGDWKLILTDSDSKPLCAALSKDQAAA